MIEEILGALFTGFILVIFFGTEKILIAYILAVAAIAIAYATIMSFGGDITWLEELF